MTQKHVSGDAGRNLLENADTIEFTPDEVQRHIDILQQVRQMKEFYLEVRTRFAALAQR
jgi:hypothetical protein